jgi:4-hydroxybenzoate polyprenyltransferase
MYELLSTWSFWLGLLYAVFPLNLLVYGLNDYTDVELDAKNDRKGNFMYGAKCSPQQMQALPHLIVLMNVGGIALLAAVTGRWAALTVWLVICFAVNGAYNLPPLCLSSRGPWELPCVVVGFSGVAPLASIVNQIGWPPLGFVAHMTCLVLRTQLWTEFLDYEPDLACGRRTTSTLVGKAWSKVLVVFFLVAEAAVTFCFFDDVLLMISTCVGVVAFVCLEVVTGTTDQEKKKAMKVQTGVGFSLVFWIWYRGLFAARPL